MTQTAFVIAAPLLRHPSWSITSSSRKAHVVKCSQTEPTSQTEVPSEDEKNVCAGCGREGGPVNGCDENGRIIGGLGAVVKWWPIKAYRPCPDFLNTKKKYKRAGQSLDEIAFGRKSSGDDQSISERLRGK